MITKFVVYEYYIFVVIKTFKQGMPLTFTIIAHRRQLMYSRCDAPASTSKQPVIFIAYRDEPNVFFSAFILFW